MSRLTIQPLRNHFNKCYRFFFCFFFLQGGTFPQTCTVLKICFPTVSHYSFGQFWKVMSYACLALLEGSLKGTVGLPLQKGKDVSRYRFLKIWLEWSLYHIPKFIIIDFHLFFSRKLKKSGRVLIRRLLMYFRYYIIIIWLEEAADFHLKTKKKKRSMTARAIRKDFRLFSSSSAGFFLHDTSQF